MENDQASPAADGLAPSNISGGVQHNVPPHFWGLVILNEEFVRSDRPKSVRSARPFSDIKTLDWNRLSQTGRRFEDNETYSLYISMVQWVRCEIMHVT